MKPVRQNRLFISVAVLMGILFMIVIGCDLRTRHKVLTFFFTGVPSLEEMKKQKEAEEKKTGAEIAKAEVSEALPEETEVKPKQLLFSHTPYIEGRCETCHKTASSFAMFRSKGPTTDFSKGGGRPGVLIAPRKELCAKCHESISSASEASLKGLWLHTAAAEGDCNICHDPHQSKYPKLLLEKPEVICFLCHSGKKIITLPDHNEPGNCLDCHNPHIGKDKLLLKKDYKEEKQKAVNKGG